MFDPLKIFVVERNNVPLGGSPSGHAQVDMQLGSTNPAEGQYCRPPYMYRQSNQ